LLLQEDWEIFIRRISLCGTEISLWILDYYAKVFLVFAFCMKLNIKYRTGLYTKHQVSGLFIMFWTVRFHCFVRFLSMWNWLFCDVLFYSPKYTLSTETHIHTYHSRFISKELQGCRGTLDIPPTRTSSSLSLSAYMSPLLWHRPSLWVKHKENKP
jgi:hypothetical protein